jgi:hypothetical protein
MRPPRPGRSRPRLVAAVTALVLAGGLVVPGRADPETASFADRLAGTLESALLGQAPALDPRVLLLALEAHDRAQERGLLGDPRTLTVIDYSRPSVEPRFWVFDLAARRLLFEERVAHGRNSGENFATRFSNAESSLESSLGLFVTGGVYTGKHGVSLRLEGLEPGFNDHARERAIVIHGADYVGPAAVATLGFLGRSWGCPALPRDVAPRVIERLRGGSAVFAYYPDPEWLAGSRFLRTGGAASDASNDPRTETQLSSL